MATSAASAKRLARLLREGLPAKGGKRIVSASKTGSNIGRGIAQAIKDRIEKSPINKTIKDKPVTKRELRRARARGKK